MPFADAIKTCFAKFVTFRGRASRSEYWKFYLFVVIGIFTGVVVIGSIGPIIPDDSSRRVLVLAVFSTILVLMVPFTSVTVRRLHDIEYSGWMYWVQIIPVLGAIVFLVWMCTKGTDGDNDYGPDPLGPDVEAVFG